MKSIVVLGILFVIVLVLVQILHSKSLMKENFEDVPTMPKEETKEIKKLETVPMKEDIALKKEGKQNTKKDSKEQVTKKELDSPKKSLWQEAMESKKEDEDSDSTVSKLNIQRIRRPNPLDEKEKEYEENLQNQERLLEKMKNLENERAKEFQKEYFESAKIDKEIGDLKKKIQELEADLQTCKSKPEEKEETTKESIRVGCKTDKDCNLFYGEGKNVCKSDNQCRCEVGSGELCQYGPTNYKDPKDMTSKERKIFKNMSNYDNFTIQDYKNWLILYQKDYYQLSDEHLINLRKILRGEPIRLRDIPTSGIYPPDTSQKYFAQMYDKITNSEAIVAPINSSTTGIQIGYNYNDYSEFSPPDSLVSLKVVNGEIERKYRRPSEKNKIFPVPLEDAIGPYQKNPNI